MNRYMCTLGVVVAIATLAGCSGGGGQENDDPIDVLRGTWTCTGPNISADGETTKWTFVITDDQITIDNPASGISAKEAYEVKGSTLNITDADAEWLLLQQGYEEPVTVELPAKAPGDGEGFPTTIALPNGDNWKLDISLADGVYSIAVADPRNQSWACAEGADAPPAATGDTGSSGGQADQEPDADPAPAVDTSTALGWCEAALTESGVLDLLSAADLRGSAFVSNKGVEQLGWSWDCTYNSAGTGGAAATNFAPASWSDPAEAINYVLSPDNPLFVAESKNWNGSQPGAVAYGTPTQGALTVTGVAEVLASDGTPGTVSLSIYFGDGTSETVVPTAVAAMESYFGFAVSVPPTPTTDGPAHSE